MIKGRHPLFAVKLVKMLIYFQNWVAMSCMSVIHMVLTDIRPSNNKLNTSLY